jgi:hypothetical protein
MIAFVQRLFAVAGLLAIVLVALTSFDVFSGRARSEAEQQFAALLLHDLSTEWQVAKIGDRLSPRAAEQLETASARAWLTAGRTLGRFTAADRFRTEGLDLTRALTFRARFERGDADVRLVLARAEDRMLVEVLELRTPAALEGAMETATGEPAP